MLAFHSILKALKRRREQRKISSAGNISLFSPARGQLTFKGKPLAGVEVNRTCHYSWRDKDKVETIYTDENGCFEFGEIKTTMRLGKLLPHEAVIPQQIEAVYNDTPFLLWNLCKRNYDTLGEVSILHDLTHVDSALIKSFSEGYILINADLSEYEEKCQSVDSYTRVFSIADLGFPFQQTFDSAKQFLQNNETLFHEKIEIYFRENPNFFDAISEEEWNEEEEKNLLLYRDCCYDSLNRIPELDVVDINNFKENYGTEKTEIEIHGEVILNVMTKSGISLEARVWLSSGRFEIANEKVLFFPNDYTFRINAFNINPEKDE